MGPPGPRGRRGELKPMQFLTLNIIPPTPCTSQSRAPWGPEWPRAHRIADTNLWKRIMSNITGAISIQPYGYFPEVKTTRIAIQEPRVFEGSWRVIAGHCERSLKPRVSSFKARLNGS